MCITNKNLIAIARQVQMQKQIFDHDKERLDVMMSDLKQKLAERTELRDSEGILILTYRQNADTTTVDYKAIVEFLKVPEDIIQRFTKTKKGNRPLLFK